MIETGKVPNGKHLHDANNIQNLYRCVVLQKNPRKVTHSLILQSRRIILDNIGEPEPICREEEIVIQKLLNTYYLKFSEGYHPMEQINNFADLCKQGKDRVVRKQLVRKQGTSAVSESSPRQQEGQQCHRNTCKNTGDYCTIRRFQVIKKTSR